MDFLEIVAEVFDKIYDIYDAKKKGATAKELIFLVIASCVLIYLFVKM